MNKHTDSNPDMAWAKAKVATLIHDCTERAALVLAWADEILDTWL